MGPVKVGFVVFGIYVLLVIAYSVDAINHKIDTLNNKIDSLIIKLK